MEPPRWIEISEEKTAFVPPETPQFNESQRLGYKGFSMSSEELEDYYEFLVSHEKHIDSIISAEEASRVVAKKSIEPSPLKGEVTEEEFQNIISDNPRARVSGTPLIETQFFPTESLIEDDLTKILEEVSSEQVSPLKKEEELVYFQVFQEFETEKEELIQEFEEEIAQAVEETEKALKKYWEKKIQELERQIEAKKEGFYSNKEPVFDNTQRLVQEKEVLKKKIKQDLEENLRPELEFELKEQISVLEQKKEHENSKRPRHEIERQKNQQEFEREIRLVSEKETWRRENGPMIIEESKLLAEQEKRNFIEQKRSELEKQMETEIEELIREVESESAKQLEEEILQIQQKAEWEYSKIMEEAKKMCYKELTQEQDYKLHTALAERLEQQLENDIRHQITSKIELEVKLRNIDRLRGEAEQEVDLSQEEILLKMQTEHQNRLLELEKKYEEIHNESVIDDVDHRISRREKELNIMFLKRKDKINKELEEKYDQICEKESNALKNALSKEKSEVARLKSRLNVSQRQFAEKRKKEMQMLKQQEELLERKIRDLEYQDYYYEQYASVSSFIKLDSQSVPIEIESSPQPEIIEKLPKPLPPPSLEVGILSPEAVKSPQIENRRLLEPYSSKEIATNLMNENLERAKKEVWSLPQDEIVTRKLVPEESVKVEVTLKEEPLYVRKSVEEPVKEPGQVDRRRLYEELLKLHHGVIEPRNR